jgi:hypothetical protein
MQVFNYIINKIFLNNFIAADVKFIHDMNQEFAYNLFCELVKDYQSQKNTQSMDCFSLAIQVGISKFEWFNNFVMFRKNK